jgi:hypothetical protein
VTMNACVTTKRDYIVGEGWRITNLKDNEQPDQEFVDWAKSINNRNETLNRAISQASEYLLRYGNVFIEFVRGSVAGKKFVKIYVHNDLECRLGEPDEDDIPRTVVRSKRFKDVGIINFGATDQATEIPIFDPLRKRNSWKKDGKVERTMIHLKNEFAGVDYYGMPSNVSALPQAVLEYEFARYNMDDLENNMNPGGMLILQGNFSQTEANKIGKEIVKTYTGKGKRGRTMVIASEQGLENSKFEKFDTQKDGSFVESDKRVEEKIIFANQWDRLLAGLSDSGSMGKGNAYILNLFRLKYQTVIKPIQKYLIESFLSVAIEVVDDWTGTKWKNYEFDLLTNTPISILESDKMIDTWTVDEVRKEGGLPALGGDRGAMLVGDLIKSKSNVQDQPAQT